MDPVLRDKVTKKLTWWLKRAPTEAEIINGPSDANLMMWIAQDDGVTNQTTIDVMKQDIKDLKKKTSL